MAGPSLIPSGDFRTSAFVAYAAIRPWLWPTVMRLNKNSDIAIKQLCTALEQTIKRYARTKTTTGLIVNA